MIDYEQTTESKIQVLNQEIKYMGQHYAKKEESLVKGHLGAFFFGGLAIAVVAPIAAPVLFIIVIASFIIQKHQLSNKSCADAMQIRAEIKRVEASQ